MIKSLTNHCADDNFVVARNHSIGKVAFAILLAVTVFLGAKVSKKKQLKSKRKAVVLGMLLRCRLGGFCVTAEKVTLILADLHELVKSRGRLEFTRSETVCGRISWAAYFSTHGTHYSLPIIALKWMPLKLRVAALSQPDHPIGREIRAAIDW